MLSEQSPATTTKVRTVSEHTRRVQQKDDIGEAQSVPFFDETRVPVETITVPNPYTQGLAADQYGLPPPMLIYA
jgi:transposase